MHAQCPSINVPHHGTERAHVSLSNINERACVTLINIEISICREVCDFLSPTTPLVNCSVQLVKNYSVQLH